MQPITTFIRRKKISLITLVVTVCVILLALGMSFSGFNQATATISNISTWMNQHQRWFLLWHGLILCAIYVGWGWRIDQLATKKQLTIETIKKIKRYRWLLIGAILLFDMVVYC